MSVDSTYILASTVHRPGAIRAILDRLLDLKYVKGSWAILTGPIDPNDEYRLWDIAERPRDGFAVVARGDDCASMAAALREATIPPDVSHAFMLAGGFDFAHPHLAEYERIYSPLDAGIILMCLDAEAEMQVFSMYTRKRKKQDFRARDIITIATAMEETDECAAVRVMKEGLGPATIERTIET